MQFPFVKLREPTAGRPSSAWYIDQPDSFPKWFNITTILSSSSSTHDDAKDGFNLATMYQSQSRRRRHVLQEWRSQFRIDPRGNTSPFYSGREFPSITHLQCNLPFALISWKISESVDCWMIISDHVDWETVIPASVNHLRLDVEVLSP